MGYMATTKDRRACAVIQPEASAFSPNSQANLGDVSSRFSGYPNLDSGKKKVCIQQAAAQSVPHFEITNKGGKNYTKAAAASARAQVRADYLPKEIASDILQQYNQFVSDDPELAQHKFPPLKISIRNGGVKGILKKSELLDPASLFITKHKHAVFTEGISSISKKKEPPFYVRTRSLLRSNMPETVLVAREKSKLVIDLKRSKKHPGFTNVYADLAQFENMPLLPFVPPLNLPTVDIGQSALLYTSENYPRTKKATKTLNQIDRCNNPQRHRKLSPIGKTSDSGGKQVHHKTSKSRTDLSWPPHPPTNSPHRWPGTGGTTSSSRSESKLSVVSIGGSVTPTYSDRSRRHIRNLYPLYDHWYEQQELYRRSLFSSRTDTSLVVKQGMGMSGRMGSSLQDLSASLNSELKQMKFNSREMGGMKEKRQRGRRRKGPEPVDSGYSDSDHDLGRTPSVNGYDMYYYHKKAIKRMAARSMSAASSSTTGSHMPINPPPSAAASNREEEQRFTDQPRGMLPVQEERTQSIISLPTNIPVTDEPKSPDQRSNHADDDLSKSRLGIPKVIVEKECRPPLPINTVNLDCSEQLEDPQSNSIANKNAYSYLETSIFETPRDYGQTEVEPKVAFQTLQLFPSSSPDTTPTISVISESGEEETLFLGENVYERLRTQSEIEEAVGETTGNEIPINTKTLTFVSPLRSESNAKRQ